MLGPSYYKKALFKAILDTNTGYSSPTLLLVDQQSMPSLHTILLRL